MRNVTETVKQLIIINILFFVGTLALGDPAYKMLSMYFPENPNFQVWQPISHMFMHGGFMHIFFNMFALYSFGSALESIWGSKKFLFFYISCGLGAALLHTGINYYYFQDGVNILIEQGFSKTEILAVLNGKGNDQIVPLLNSPSFQNFVSAYFGTVVGASGAIYGVIVAFAFMFPNAELALMFIPVPIKAKYFVPGLVLVDLYLGVSGQSIFGGGGGIAHFAHVGGALFGFIIMWYWKKNQFNKNRWN
ncbi:MULTISPECIES: rhomboid family intramembrane serine protease [Flavobacterium]|uniref:Rhomboid family intramembrane serine protease n=1 Tax=Flavobacterium gawalongense TaxID=2594432 RepID=A0A553BZ95_9FLAO|nr:rhomboid family intramembrane serine protease [Flavobacterium gawalongense]TRX04639.1 rhomboid family intramembrane serine protease [Flavobacterium gawalongense]TRX10526.1 rhomboid family intramembrane serine protease [Flavobacterium gawalongense]TRX13569.1 rhomboid family intramembrane serine protease [Flavobacterium gawalongense]TRX15499.1 rhomboid family intramembrane serine protease [Flavobacterium gawalongense]TRX31338.1 rhomboid family intramembrane serine protease [Flavobacterium gaw